MELHEQYSQNIIKDESSKFINNKFYNDNGDVISIQISDTRFNLIKYKNEFGLILNKIKPYFNLIYNIFYKLELDGNKYLMYKSINDISLLEFEKFNVNSKKIINSNITEIRKILVFNWLMCVNQNTLSEVKNNIRITTFSDNRVINFKNISSCHLNLIFNYFNESLEFNNMYSKKYLTSGSKDLPKTIIKEYFDNSIELFYDYVCFIMDGIDPTNLKIELLKIVRKYNQEYIPWVNVVYERLLSAKNLTPLVSIDTGTSEGTSFLEY